MYLTHLSYHILLCLSKTKTADAYRFYHTYFYSRSFSKLYRRSKFCGKISSEIYIAFQAAVAIIFLTNFRQQYTYYFSSISGRASIPIICPAVFRPFFRIFAIWGPIIFLSLHTMLLSVFRLTKKHPAEHLSSPQKFSRFLFEDFLAAKAYFSAFFALLIFTMP